MGMMSLNDVFSVLSDEDSIEIIKTVIGGQDPKISDFESPKRYYSRLSKLKNAGILKKNGKSYEVTAFGSVVYDMFQKVGLAHNLYWKLQVIDSIGNHVPDHERKQIIESLIPDNFIREILVQYKLTNRTVGKVKEIVHQLP